MYCMRIVERLIGPSSDNKLQSVKLETVQYHWRNRESFLALKTSNFPYDVFLKNRMKLDLRCMENAYSIAARCDDGA